MSWVCFVLSYYTHPCLAMSNFFFLFLKEKTEEDRKEEVREGGGGGIGGRERNML